MEKKVIVKDEFGKQVGFTYPKRARGLVKNGRAEYVGDCEIRMKKGNKDNCFNTHAPIGNIDTEEIIMSNVINFNAKEFSFDKSCEDNVGSRMFIIGLDGKTTEVLEIGDWGWNWSQIKCEKHLAKNTDYIFRFAMTGGYCDTGEEVSQLIIFNDENWDDRYTYPLAKSAYAPVLSKKWDEGILRVYEIPFNTGEAEKTTLVFTAQKAVARFMPALNNESYEGLENMSYGQWWNEQSKASDNGSCSGNGSGFGSVIDLCGANIGASALKDLLNNVPFVHAIDLSGANIYDDSGEAQNDSAETVEAEIVEPKDENDKPFMETAVNAMKLSLAALTEQIDAAPEGSPQRIAMQEVLDSLKSQINSNIDQFENSEEQE